MFFLQKFKYFLFLKIQRDFLFLNFVEIFILSKNSKKFLVFWKSSTFFENSKKFLILEKLLFLKFRNVFIFWKLFLKFFFESSKKFSFLLKIQRKKIFWENFKVWMIFWKIRSNFGFWKFSGVLVFRKIRKENFLRKISKKFLFFWKFQNFWFLEIQDLRFFLENFYETFFENWKTF